MKRTPSKRVLGVGEEDDEGQLIRALLRDKSIGIHSRSSTIMESYERCSSSSSGSAVSALLITEQEKYSSSTTSSLPPLCRGSQASMMPNGWTRVQSSLP
eukprot:scaffold16240_cov116-Skeletonema_dohrnii-CCMP3373.AAC.4